MIVRITTPALSGGFRHMLTTGSITGWQRPAPVFQPDDGSGNPAASDPVDPVDPAPPAPPAAPAAPKTSDEAAKLLKEVMTLKTKLKEKDEAIRRFDGIDPEAVRTLLAEREEAERARQSAEEDRLKKAGEFETVQKAMREAHQRDLEAERAKAQAEAKRVAELARTIEELTVGSAFANSQFLREDTVLTASKARRVYGAHFDVVDGVITPYSRERGEDGREPLVDAGGQPLPFDAAMKAIIAADSEHEQLLRSKTRAGSGATPSPTKTPSSPPAGKPSSFDIIKAGLNTLARVDK